MLRVHQLLEQHSSGVQINPWDLWTGLKMLINSKKKKKDHRHKLKEEKTLPVYWLCLRASERTDPQRINQTRSTAGFQISLRTRCTMPPSDLLWALFRFRMPVKIQGELLQFHWPRGIPKYDTIYPQECVLSDTLWRKQYLLNTGCICQAAGAAAMRS